MKRNKGDAELVAIIVVGALIFAAAFAIAGIVAYFSCHARWDKAGMADVAWGPMQGCLVKMPDGRWLPSDRVREFELPRPK
jgi:hypothetical protein